MARARKKPKRNRAPAKKRAKKRSRKAGIKKRVRAMGVRPRRIPARKKGESYVHYHDRLSDLIYEANQAGDLDYSAALQARAGELAAKHPSIHRPRRSKKRGQRGPGTYPWDQCVDDQLVQYGSMDRARKVCGRIRADSRSRYPVYWSIRGTGRRRNPDLPGDYAIVVAPDDYGYHWWASDESGQRLAAASTKPEGDEEAAVRAAKKAIRRYEERTYGGKPKATKGRKKKDSQTKRKRSLSSILRI
jgi:hypothetical protein